MKNSSVGFPLADRLLPAIRLFCVAGLLAIAASAAPTAARDAASERAAPAVAPVTESASYVVRVVETAPPRIVVSATLPSAGAELRMAQSWPGDVQEVAEAGWPGLVRNLRVADAEGREVAVTNAGAKGWTLATPIRGTLTLDYEIDLAPLAARGWPAPREAAYADADHVALIGRALFIFTPAQRESRVRFTLPDGWQPVVPWPALRSASGSALVASTEDLAENLIAFSRVAPDVVVAGGFRLNVVSFGHWQSARAEVRRVVGAVLPRLVATVGSRDRANYVLVLLPHAESGGESFRASFALTLEASASRANIETWGNLVAHEVFHFWNGWRLKGADYPSSQWFQEGFTEYAANLALVSSGLSRPEQFHERLAGHVMKYRKLATPLDAPGTRKGQPLYSGGALVAFIWDTKIRAATGGKRGFGDVMRALLRNTDAGARPYAWEDIQAALESVAPGDWKAFEQRYIHGTEPLPVGDAFARVGLRMTEGADGVVRVEADPGASRAATELRRALERGSR